MAPGIDDKDQAHSNPDERPKGDPKADVKKPVGGTGGGQGVDSGLHPGGPKPHGGDFGGVGSIGTGGGNTGPGTGMGREKTRDPSQR